MAVVYFAIIFIILQCLFFKETLATASIGEAHILKCTCGENQALKDELCIDYNNIIPIWDPIEEIDSFVNISEFREIKVHSLHCSEGYSKLKLFFPKFYIYPNGMLDSLDSISDPLISEYCIDHIVVAGNLALTADVCQLNPKIHMCCPENHIRDEENCKKVNQIYNAPPLIGDFSWENFTIQSKKILCKEDFVIKRIPLAYPNELGASLIGFPLGDRLLWNDLYSFEGKYFDFHNYCVSIEEDFNNNNNYYAEFCVFDPKLDFKAHCGNNTCVMKCCPDGFIYDTIYSTCVQHNFTMQWNNTFDNSLVPSNFINFYGLPICPYFHLLTAKEAVEHNIKSQISSLGYLLVEGGTSRVSTDYCVDGFINNITDSSQDVYETALVCFLEKKSLCSWRWIVGGVLMGISCLFYVFTIAVYLGISELRKRMVGRCLISEVASLLTAYIILIYLQNSDNYIGVFCNVPGAIVHVAILSSFFWLNVMCYDMWITLTSVRPAAATRGNPNKRFVWYSVYAWGMSILISGIRVIIDAIPEGEDGGPSWLLRTTLGKTHCFFSSSDPLPKWVYLYIPIIVILVANIVFFCSVAVGIVKTKRKTKKLMEEATRAMRKTDEKKTNPHLEKTILYLKLFLVMGISWIIEIILWVAVPENDCYFWILDTVNMFQGVVIFIILSAKNQPWI